MGWGLECKGPPPPPPQPSTSASDDGPAAAAAVTPTAAATAAAAPAADPQPSTFQPLSLQEVAIKSLSRHLDVFSRPRYRNMAIPVDLFLLVLRSASAHDRLHAGELMLAVVRNLPCLDCPEVDEAFWRPLVELTVGASTCPISEPYPAIVTRVRRAKNALEAWVARRREGGQQGQQQQQVQPSPHKAASSSVSKEKEEKKMKKKKSKEDKGEKKKARKDEQQQRQQQAPASTASSSAASRAAGAGAASSSHEEVQAALRLLKELDRAPASTQLLAETRAGEAVQQVSKLGEPLAPASVIGAAKALRKKWKALVQQELEQGQGSSAAGKGREEDEDGAMGPLAIGRAAIEATSWRDVYKFSLAYDKHRRAVVGRRALALAKGQEAQRHRTKEVAAWTGEDEERERRRAGKRPAAGNTERIRKMLKMRAPAKAPERAFGGLVMQPGRKKRLKVVG